jgi:hypothetical protein
MFFFVFLGITARLIYNAIPKLCIEKTSIDVCDVGYIRASALPFRRQTDLPRRWLIWHNHGNEQRVVCNKMCIIYMATLHII